MEEKWQKLELKDENSKSYHVWECLVACNVENHSLILIHCQQMMSDIHLSSCKLIAFNVSILRIKSMPMDTSAQQYLFLDKSMRYPHYLQYRETSDLF